MRDDAVLYVKNIAIDGPHFFLTTFATGFGAGAFGADTFVDGLASGGMLFMIAGIRGGGGL
jgi:hypothetical protein